MYQYQQKLKIQKTYNKAQQSLPLVAGTPKTLRFFGRPCARRYKANWFISILASIEPMLG